MSSSTLVDSVTSWLVEQAFGEPDPTELFQGMCDRIFGVGIPIGRAMVNWTTLHPLFQVEAVIWREGQEVAFEQIAYNPEPDHISEAWRQSPFKVLAESGGDVFRRALQGPEKLVDFPVLQEFADEGFTDYVAFAIDLAIPGTGLANSRSGIIVSYCCTRPTGFSDGEIAALQRVTRRFALSGKVMILSRMADTIAETYLGHRAGPRVLGGQIHRGDGETVPAIILYSDLRNSTAFAERIPRADYIDLLNSYFDCIAASIEEEGGDILNFIGDAVIALFSLDCWASETEAAQAASRAIEKGWQKLALLNEARIAAGEEPLDYGVGLTRGNVMFGNIGTASRLSFSVIGPIVNQVARVQAMTKVFGVPALAVQKVADHAPAHWTPLGEHTLRGFSEPVALYAWAGPTPHRLPEPVMETGDPSALSKKRAHRPRESAAEMDFLANRAVRAKG
ncbi:adenylate/guanylate cyclase domain-containing protein [Afifella sp. JA880]|uniref:adenylate/guanylate cyclase domain-containing protein n=1 Tax=Afifella sp. JA880 TaxID=2975280 RepID=UPI0021BA76C2|nr:adenylate/guanylate cyclase domain-containing protein [Afifella sp. JA880]MCT8268234.1 adenylate/guanylate cyclase domain-containing protein [Afifella sp. JA880]